MAMLGRVSSRSSRTNRFNSDFSRRDRQRSFNATRQNPGRLNRQVSNDQERRVPSNPLGLYGRNALGGGPTQDLDVHADSQRNRALENQQSDKSGNTQSSPRGSRDFLWPNEVELGVIKKDENPSPIAKPESPVSNESKPSASGKVDIGGGREFTKVETGDGVSEESLPSRKPNVVERESVDKNTDKKPEKNQVEPPRTPEPFDDFDRVFFGGPVESKPDNSKGGQSDLKGGSEGGNKTSSAEGGTNSTQIGEEFGSAEGGEGSNVSASETGNKEKGPKVPAPLDQDGFKAVGENRYQWESKQFGTFTVIVDSDPGAELTRESEKIILSSLKNATLNYHEKHGLTYEGRSQDRDQTVTIEIKNKPSKINQGLFHHRGKKRLEVNTDAGRIDGSARNVLEHEYTHFLQTVDYQVLPGTNLLEAQAVGNEADGGVDWVQQRVLGHALQTARTDTPQHVTIEELQNTRTSGQKGRHNEQYNTVYGHGTLFLKFLGERHPTEYDRLEAAHERGETNAFTNTNFNHLEEEWEGWFGAWANKNIVEPNIQLDPDSHRGEKGRIIITKSDSEGYLTPEYNFLINYGNKGDVDGDGEVTGFDYVLAARRYFS